MRFKTTRTRRKNVEVELMPAIAPKNPSVGSVGSGVGDITILANSKEGSRKHPFKCMVSLGRKDRITAEVVRRAGGAAARWLDGAPVRRAVVHLDTLADLELDAPEEAFVEGLALGAFRFDRRKASTKAGPEVSVDLLHAKKGGSFAARLRRTLALVDSVNLAREWSHEPPNVINPVTLAKRVRVLARDRGLRCRVFDEKQLEKMGAGALLAVGVGSETPSRLIILEYLGSPRRKNAKPVVLVGKAVTFDTGGYSIKDKKGIVGMKYDKCGGMAVIGALHAAATLELKTPVVGIIAAAENMISERAYRPNDIITTMSGKTVEIISTDAEGRMVLADALTYAFKSYRPRSVIDLATLTGGIVVALGSVRAGMFATDDRLATALFDSGERVHERLWRMPLDDEYLDLIKGDDSDLKNSGGREAHPIIGGIFLKQFIQEGIPWAHLDIAGVGDVDRDSPYCPKGGTGFGVRLLVDYLERLG